MIKILWKVDYQHLLNELANQTKWCETQRNESNERGRLARNAIPLADAGGELVERLKTCGDMDAVFAAIAEYEQKKRAPMHIFL